MLPEATSCDDRMMASAAWRTSRTVPRSEACISASERSRSAVSSLPLAESVSVRSPAAIALMRSVSVRMPDRMDRKKQ